jgi:creatinine amidohydrolase
MDAALARRLGIPLDDGQITLPDGAQADGLRFFQVNTSSPSAPGDGEAAPRYVDVHAGRSESSMMLASCASLVRDSVRRTLKSTDLGPDDLAVWRKGYEDARRTTPLGYFGDPAAASAEEGQRTLQSAAATAADAIVTRLQGKQ